MASPTEICNLALSHLGQAKEIANMETERSQDAAAFRRFYFLMRDVTLRAFHWPFARAFVSPALVTERPNSEWLYAYRYPSDCLEMRRIVSGLRVDTESTRIPYILGQDQAGSLIYTDQAYAEIEYSYRADDPSRYPADFTLAFSLRLAHAVGPRVAGGDPQKHAERALQRYDVEISRAREAAHSEEQPDIPAESEFIRARE